MLSKIDSYSEVASKVEAVEGFMVPGQDAYLFQKVQSLPHDAVIMEIGAFKGRSTVNMGYACVGTQRKIYSLDTWAGNQKDFHITDYEDVWERNIVSNGLQNYVSPIKGESQESLKNWAELSGGLKIDFIFIDGSHVMEDVFKDFQLSFPWLKVGGWVAFHDVEFTHHDVVCVWNHVAYPILTNHEYSATISCGQKRSEISIDLSSLPQDGLSNGTNPTCLFVDTYYEGFIKKFYQRNPELLTASYRDQINSIHTECFGESNFYSNGLRRQNWQSDNVIYNCQQIQGAWVREAGWDPNQFHMGNIMVAQVRDVMPEVVYFQDLSVATQEVIESVRPFTRLIVGQIACPVPKTAYLKGIDILFTSFPHYVDRFRQQGVTAYYQPLAFSPYILEKIKTNRRDLDVTFIGGISGIHSKGTEYLNHITTELPISIFGYGADSLPQSSSIRTRHRGETWGLDMFKLFSRSLITLNRHVDVAENNANNMRLFEATGCGALLITDYKDNLNQLFRIGEEVVAYRSAEECVALVKYFLKYADEAKAIAEAGQKRTLEEHTYDKRMAYTAEILERHLRYQNIAQELQVDHTDTESLFSNYQPASCEDMTLASESAWTDENLPVHQRQIVQKELEKTYAGHQIPIFHSLTNALHHIVHDSMSILDIGCASGYYNEVIDYLFPDEIDYTGIDYSESLVKMAKNLYPNAKFEIGDGVDIPYADQSYTISLSSAVLLNVHNVSAHIAEMCRVAKNFVILNRTDIVRKRETQYLKTVNYGVNMVEAWYNEEYLIDLFLSHGFKRVYTFEIDSNPQTDCYQCTYIFERTSDYRPAIRVNYNESSLGTEPDVDERWQKFSILSSLRLLHDLPADFERLDKQLKSLGQDQIDLQVFNQVFNQWIQTLNMTDAKKWFLQNLVAQGSQHILGIQNRINISYDYLQEKLSHLVNWLIFSKEVSNFTYDLTPLNMKHLAWTLVPITGKSYDQIRGMINEIVTDVNLKSHITEWTGKSKMVHFTDPVTRYGRRILWYALVRTLKPSVIIESGVHRGLGTCVLSAAITKNRAEGFEGNLYAVGIDPEAGELVQSPYKDVVKLTIQDSLDYLKTFDKSIDLFIHDSDHSAQHEFEEYQIIADKLSDESVIISDNAHSTDVLPDFAVKTGRCFTYFQESPIHHFYLGIGTGIAYKPKNQT